MSKFIAKKGEYEGGIEFSAGYRWQHWIRASSILALVITGFYIADPFITYQNVSAEPTRFLNAQFREWHIIFGFAMIGAVLYKLFFTLVTKEGKFESESIKDAIDLKVISNLLNSYF